MQIDGAAHRRDGLLTAECTPGRGTTITLHLPAGRETAADPDLASPTSRCSES